MDAMLTNLRNTVAAGFVLTLILYILVRLFLGTGIGLDSAWWTFCLRWLHVISGIMWIGLLWYFNFVQIPNMGKFLTSRNQPLARSLHQPHYGGSAGAQWRQS